MRMIADSNARIPLAAVSIIGSLGLLPADAGDPGGDPLRTIVLEPGLYPDQIMLLDQPPRTHFDASGVKLLGGGPSIFPKVPEFRLLSDPSRNPAAGVGYESTEILRVKRLPNAAVYPIQLRDMESPSLSGVTVVGTQPRELPWRIMKTIYDGDALVVRGCTGRAEVSDVHFENVEDGFGPQADLAFWSLRRAYMRHIRDDAVENDYLIDGEILDCLIDGCFVFLSHRTDGEEGADIVTTIRDCIVHVEAQAHDGYEEREWRNRYIAVGDDGIGRAPGMIFKWMEDGGTVVVENCVFRVDAISWSGPDDMGFPPGVYRDTVLVWTGKGPYPAPLPPGVTLTRDLRVWEKAREAWIRRLPTEHPAAKALRQP